MDSDTWLRLQLSSAKHLQCEALPACVVRALGPCLHPTAFLTFSRKAKCEQQSIPHFLPLPPFIPIRKRPCPHRCFTSAFFAEGHGAGCPWAGLCPATSSSPTDCSPIPEWVGLHFQPLFSWSVVLLGGLLACFQQLLWGFNFFVMWACMGQPDAQQGDTGRRTALMMHYEHSYSTWIFSCGLLCIL